MIERIVVITRSSSSGRAIPATTRMTVDPVLALDLTDDVACISLRSIRFRSFPNSTGSAFDGFKLATVAMYTAFSTWPATPAARICWLNPL